MHLTLSCLRRFTKDQLTTHAVPIWISTGAFDNECRPGDVRDLANKFNTASPRGLAFRSGEQLQSCKFWA